MKKQVVLFMVTNGIGLGHLTRGLAVAKRLQALSPACEIIFFTTSLATELIRSFGFMFFYMPTKAVLPESVTMSQWKGYMYRQLEEIVAIYKPSVIVYDGAMPYSALIEEVNRRRKMKSIWIKRESYKTGWEMLDQYEKNFDLMIIPKEAGTDTIEVEENEKRKYCEPITILNREEAHARTVVRAALGINEEENLYYIQLGAGIINNTSHILQHVQEEIGRRKWARILIGQSPIGRPIEPINTHIQVVKSYPNAQYFKGVDFAVSAAGYNTFHELVTFKVPTLFIPNENTVVDDQVARAKHLEDKGAALLLENIEQLPYKLEELEKEQVKIRKQLEAFQSENGAIKAAQYILDVLK